MNPRGWFLAAALLGAPGSPGPAAQTIAITDARVIDGTGGPAIDRATVVVRDGRISAVGPGIAVPRGARLIAGRGRTVLPGLADLHTHLTGGWDGEAVDFVGYRRMLAALLYSGVTTVLDPGDVTSWVKQLKTEIAAGRLEGPRIYFTGPVFDGPTPIWPDISNAISSSAQLPHFVDGLKVAGATFLKGYVGLSDSSMRALVDTARTRSLRVIADVGQRNGSLATAATGVAAFAHAGSRPVSDEAIHYLADHGTVVISTLAVYESFAGRRFRDLRFLDHPLLADILPPNYRTAIRAFPGQGASARDSIMTRRLSEAFATASSNVRRLAEGGVTVVAGTDAPYPGNYYGEGLQRELELLVEAGLSPLAAIAAATGRAARFVDPGAEWGTIAPGRVADLLVVQGNPASRISDTRNIVALIQGGRIVDRSRLRYDPLREVDHHPSPLRPR